MEFDYLCGFLNKYISPIRTECREDLKPKHFSWLQSENNFFSVYGKQVNKQHPVSAIWNSVWGFSDYSHLLFILPGATDSLIDQHLPFALWMTPHQVLYCSRDEGRNRQSVMLVNCSALLVNTSTSYLKRQLMLFVSVHHLLCHKSYGEWV